MDKDTLNNYRFENCLAFIKAKDSKAEYQNLINSGTLRYLCQTTIELRQLANHHAHEIDMDMRDFREVLHAAISATPANLSPLMINGIVEFLIAVTLNSSWLVIG